MESLCTYNKLVVYGLGFYAAMRFTYAGEVKLIRPYFQAASPKLLKTLWGVSM